MTYSAREDAELIRFLDEEVPGWREMEPDDIKAQLMAKVDEYLDLYNLLKENL